MVSRAAFRFAISRWKGSLIQPDAMEPCGKEWHRSRESATNRMSGMKSTRGPEFVLNVYYCKGCDGFHVGHTRVRIEAAQ